MPIPAVERRGLIGTKMGTLEAHNDDFDVGTTTQRVHASTLVEISDSFRTELYCFSLSLSLAHSLSLSLLSSAGFHRSLRLFHCRPLDSLQVDPCPNVIQVSYAHCHRLSVGFALAHSRILPCRHFDRDSGSVGPLFYLPLVTVH